MLSFLKKKSEAAAAPASPAWHPNFRNYEKLPDIKVVRTAFFVNVGAVTLTLACAILYGRAEWQVRSLRSQVVEQERIIQKNKATSQKAEIDFGKFKAEEAKIAEVDAFVKSRPTLSDILIHLGETRPPEVALDSFEFREIGLVLRLTVRGAPEAAAGHATAYKDQLAADKKLLETFGEASFQNFTTNPTTGRLAVEIVLPMKAAAPKK